MFAPSSNEQQSLQRLAVTAKRARHARAELVDVCLVRIDALSRNHPGTRGHDYDRLMEAGVVGLLRALERYDAALGTPFWSYAAWWVRQAMQQFVDELMIAQNGSAADRGVS